MNEIIQKDCLEVMRGFRDNQFDLCLTDPPYGKQYARGKHGFGDNASLNQTLEDVAWDKFTPGKEYFDEILRVSRNQIIFGGNYFTDKLPPSNCWLVWDKKGDKSFNNPFADCELVWTSFNKVVRKYTLIQQGFVSQSADERVHPTQKPTELLKLILEDFPAVTVLDPFAGSGSTLVAAKALGIPYLGVEVNQEYCAIARKRLEETNRQNKLL